MGFARTRRTRTFSSWARTSVCMSRSTAVTPGSASWKGSRPCRCTTCRSTRAMVISLQAPTVVRSGSWTSRRSSSSRRGSWRLRPTCSSRGRPSSTARRPPVVSSPRNSTSRSRVRPTGPSSGTGSPKTRTTTPRSSSRTCRAPRWRPSTAPGRPGCTGRHGTCARLRSRFPVRPPRFATASRSKRASPWS